MVKSNKTSSGGTGSKADKSTELKAAPAKGSKPRFPAKATAKAVISKGVARVQNSKSKSKGKSATASAVPPASQTPLAGSALGIATVPKGFSRNETTHEVDYLSIFNCKTMPWFMNGVRELQKAETSFPATSHAFSKVMAGIHRRHPKISFGYLNEDTDQVEAFKMTEYESAGLWADESNEACLVVNAAFEDGAVEMLLLYMCNYCESVADIKEECQWATIEGSDQSAKASTSKGKKQLKKSKH